MYCTHCGQELIEGGKFCPRCGAPVDGNGFEASEGPQAEPGVEPGENFGVKSGVNPQEGLGAPGPGYPGAVARKKTSPAVIAVIVAVIVFLAICSALAVWLLFFRNTYKTPIKNMVKVIEEQDGEAAMDLIPEQYLTVARTMTGLDEDAMEEMPEASLGTVLEGYEGKIKIDYEIGDARDLTDFEIQNLESGYFGFLGEIEAAKEVEFSAEIFVDGEEVEEIADDTTLTVIRLDGKWYLDPSMLF